MNTPTPQAEIPLADVIERLNFMATRDDDLSVIARQTIAQAAQMLSAQRVAEPPILGSLVTKPTGESYLVKEDYRQPRYWVGSEGVAPGYVVTPLVALAASHPPAEVPQTDDAALLDWLQTRGATVEVLLGVAIAARPAWKFRVAGLYAATNPDIRTAIRAAIAASPSTPKETR